MAWPQTVRKEDLRIDYYRGSGKGGQHRNKTDSACRITHLPTGIVAKSEDQRKQPQNRKTAFKRLAEKLIPLMKKAAKPETRATSDERVRNYHEPRQQVKDHTVDKTYDYSDVLNGKGLDKIMEDRVVQS